MATDDFFRARLDGMVVLLRPVYNFEVEEFHTYYVADVGVWVHNTNCPVDVALGDEARKAELQGACFDGETVVHIDVPNEWGDCVKEIEYIEVGDLVLSRCEKTGEMAYKRVVSKFTHGVRQQYYLGRKYGPEIPDFANGPLFVTEEHPFWVKGKGWVPVRDLRLGDEFITYDGVHAEFEFLEKAGIHEVYNLEVEDFHTYFVDHSGLWVHNEKAPVKISSQSLTQVEGALPEWSPLYKSTAELTGPDGMPLSQKAAIQLTEQLVDQKLAGAGISRPCKTPATRMNTGFAG
ncbi:MAG: hypothetical protein C4K60_11370 [Ideonella sp. MAG2]|nr:MAG: hypothetical protein C4K60_11370 [Ideonella sp. MAG2]